LRSRGQYFTKVYPNKRADTAVEGSQRMRVMPYTRGAWNAEVWTRGRDTETAARSSFESWFERRVAASRDIQFAATVDREGILPSSVPPPVK
jgi:hypothetical protein